MNELSNDELLLISECIIKAMNGIADAREHLIGSDLIDATNAKLYNLSKLNEKVISLIR
jgi:hypothetical protein